MFRRRRGSKGFQTKQFNLQGTIVENVASAVPSFFASDVVVLGPDQLFGLSSPVQASMKKVSVVGIDYYWDAFSLISADQDILSQRIVQNNYFGWYKDTLDSSGNPDATGDFFLNVDQVNGATNQQAFPERVLDRRSFSAVYSDVASNGFLTNMSGPQNPGINAERRVRRRVSITNREAIIFRVEALMPAIATGGTAALEFQVYGVITFRVDL